MTDPELEALLRQERAEEAWAEFVMDERPQALAKYLRLGGEVCDKIRSALIVSLEQCPGGRRGGRRPYRDWTTYLEIELIMNSPHLYQEAPTSETRPTTRRSTATSISKRKACEIFASLHGLELRAVERQHDRGRKVNGLFG